MKSDSLVSFTALVYFPDSLAAMPVQVRCNGRVAMMGTNQFVLDFLNPKGENHDK